MPPKKITPKSKAPKKQASASYSQFASTTQSNARRMLFIGGVTDQRKEVTSATRTAMMARSRWAMRNSPIYKQCVDEAVLISVGDGLVAQSQAKNPKTAIAHDKYFKDWSVRCDLTRRYNLGQLQTMWMSGAIIDGDSWGIMTNDPKTGVPAIQILVKNLIAGKSIFEISHGGDIPAINVAVKTARALHKDPLQALYSSHIPTINVAIESRAVKHGA